VDLRHNDRANRFRYRGGPPGDRLLGRALRGAAGEAGRAPVTPTRFRSLLVPVDGSPFGEHALPLALGIARRAGASVRLVHVHSPLESVYRADRLYFDTGLDALLKWERRAYLDDLVRRVAKVADVPVTSVLMERREVAGSLSAAAGLGADLVVMATHGRGPLGRAWRGSVADGLLRRASVPVLLVRGYDAPADLTGDPPLRHVLTALDGSELAEQALGPAVALGALRGADHTLLRVAPLSADSPAGDDPHAAAWGYLRRVEDRLGGRTRRVRAQVFLDQQPTAEAILWYARRHDADLIALATRGRGGLGRLLRGSLADRVVRGADVPVLVVPPDAGAGP
jgi:nucleotide-binding universal stress UspA family protein